MFKLAILLMMGIITYTVAGDTVMMMADSIIQYVNYCLIFIGVKGLILISMILVTLGLQALSHA